MLGYTARGDATPHLSVKMDFLLSAGFDEEQVSTVLNSVSGNLDLAIAILCDGAPSSEQPPALAAPTAHTSQDEVWAVTCGCSQFTFGAGASACTAVCVEAAQRLLSMEPSMNLSKPCADADFLSDIVFQGVALHGAVLAELGDGRQHTAADEVLGSVALREGRQRQRPLVTLATMLQADLSQPGAFESLLGDAMRRYGHADLPSLGAAHVAVIVTKPPETVLALLPVPPPLVRANPTTAAATNINTVTALEESSFVLFDSHPRPVIGQDGVCVPRLSEP